jgi:hydrogenase maturation factor HypF (carbamoyltransferase family)
MELEFAVQPGVEDAYSFSQREESPLVLDWHPAILEIIDDLHKGKTRPMISAKFHNMLAEMLVAVAQKTGQESGFKRRLLSESLSHRTHDQSPYRRGLPSVLASANSTE